MKVLHIVARFAEGGGITEVVLGLTRAFASADIQGGGILTLAEEGLDPFAERCRAARVRLHTAAPGWRHTLWYSRDWLKQFGLIVPEYDLVHIHGLWLYPLLATVAWCARHGVPFVFSPHGSLLPSALAQSGWKKRLLSPWVRRVYRQAACIHVTSEAETDSVRNFWGEQCPVVVCVPEGVEMGRSSLVHYCDSALVGEDGAVGKPQSAESTNLPISQPANPPSPRSKFLTNAPSRDAVRERTVLYLGRVSPEKNLDALVDAWERLGVEKRKGWVLRLVGFPKKGGSRYADKLAERCTRFSDVRIAPFCDVDQKWSMLAGSDILVLPSVTENFGIVVAESLACGVPVITTKGAPWAELLGNSASALVHYCESSLVENEQKSENGNQKSGVSGTNELMNFRTNELTRTGRAGWWVDIGADALAEALREALSLTDAERLELGENGKMLVADKYSWPIIASEMERVYEWVAGQGSQPSCVRRL